MKQLTFSFIGLLTLIAFSCQVSQENTTSKRYTEPVAALYDSTLRPFYHGVASGDPLQDRVIIWTRVTPEDSLQQIEVGWEMATDEQFRSVINSGTQTTTPAKDYTVKIDVDKLKPGTSYYYRFSAFGKKSIVGHTKTLPVQADSVKLAIVSCSNWEFGYFNAYDRLADRELDAVIHLGDYIYEYAVGVYGDTTVDRKHLPAHEIVSLQDYRTRYSQYHLDEGLRRARQLHPFITIWDDHEVANNVYKEGAQNHQPDQEGDFNDRKNVARQAYYEWIPIRESRVHYRSFSFGKLADLIMLDERLEGRTKQPDSLTDPALSSKQHTMLGSQQLKWFEDQLSATTATWKVIGNQVIFSDLDQSGVRPKEPRNLDSWDGYPEEKKQIENFIIQKQIKNVVFLAGDTHSTWAFEVAEDPFKKYDARTSRGAFAVEFGTTSVSSGNANEYIADDTVKRYEQILMRTNPHLKYNNLRDHGYLLLTLSPAQAKAQWFMIETLRTKSKNERLDKQLVVKAGSGRLQ